MTEANNDISGSGIASANVADEFLQKLRGALGRNGDFPASAKIVTELKVLISNPQTTANQMAEVILREPSLGMRILHLVNSSFYKRAKPITTISQAIVQIGMKPLAEMCSSLVLLQRFVPEARKNSAFAVCLRKSVLTSVLCSSISEISPSNAARVGLSKGAESGYLAGTINEIGVLLMAYYFPQVYESALKRSETKEQDLALSIQQIIGLTPAQLSAEVIRTLNLPQIYGDIVVTADALGKGNTNFLQTVSAEVLGHSKNLSAASSIAETVSTSNSVEEACERIEDISAKLGIDAKKLNGVLTNLNVALEEHCSALELSLPPIAIALEQIQIGPIDANSDAAHATAGAGPAMDPKLDLGELQSSFDEYLEEIKQALATNQPTASIVTSAMEACAYCLKFDRVILLLAGQGRRNLIGRMVLGTIPGGDPTKVSRQIGAGADPLAPDNQAFTSGTPVFEGTPIFPDGGEFAAIPIGSGNKTVGVVYAERLEGYNGKLSTQEKLAISTLASQLDRSLQRTKVKDC